MEEKTIKINTNISLPEVVGAIRKGEWKIPRFQREFVWEKKKVIELIKKLEYVKRNQVLEMNGKNTKNTTENH